MEFVEFDFEELTKDMSPEKVKRIRERGARWWNQVCADYDYQQGVSKPNSDVTGRNTKQDLQKL